LVCAAKHDQDDSNLRVVPSPSLALRALAYPRTGTVHVNGWRRARRSETDRKRGHLDEGVENFAEVDARDGHLQLKGGLHTEEWSEKCGVIE
jgi:hypothetical protein